jgi:hypothetical protein
MKKIKLLLQNVYCLQGRYVIEFGRLIPTFRRNFSIIRIMIDTYHKALETEHFFLQGLHKGNPKVLSKGGLGQSVYWQGTCT